MATETAKNEQKYYVTLLSIGTEIKFLNNDKKTPYRWADVKLENGNEVSAQLFEANLAYGMTEGKRYLMTVTEDDNGDANCKLSHLTPIEKAKMSVFAGCKEVKPYVKAVESLAQLASAE